MHAEELEYSVSSEPLVRAHQGRMLVRGPLMETEQSGYIRVADLTQVVMSRSRFGLPKERLVPFEAVWNISDADDCPCALHYVSPPNPDYALAIAAGRACRPRALREQPE